VSACARRPRDDDGVLLGSPSRGDELELGPGKLVGGGEAGVRAARRRARCAARPPRPCAARAGRASRRPRRRPTSRPSGSTVGRPITRSVRQHRPPALDDADVRARPRRTRGRCRR
jgi:hypothetical protein